MFKTQVIPNVSFQWPVQFLATWPHHERLGRIEKTGKISRRFTVQGANHFNFRNNIAQQAEVERIAKMKPGDDIGGGYLLGKRDGFLWAFKPMANDMYAIYPAGSGTTGQALATIALAEATHDAQVAEAKAAADAAKAAEKAKAKEAKQAQPKAEAKPKAAKAKPAATVQVKTGK